MSKGEDYKIFSNSTEQNFSVDLGETVFVNSNWEMSLINLVMFMTNNLTILIVNVVVLVWLKIKENTLVDRMVLVDCLANISTIGVMLLAFPIRVWGNSYLCLLITFFRSFVLVLNRFHATTLVSASAHPELSRIIALTVVLYRVLMVCHVEFCHRHSEKVIRDKLFRYDNLLCLLFLSNINLNLLSRQIVPPVPAVDGAVCHLLSQ